MKTRFKTKEQALADRKWVLIDAKDQIVGRLATKIASILRGKENPSFNTHNDTGDFVVVVNADQIKFTGDKELKEVYYRHTGFVGGLKAKKKSDILSAKPELVLERAVKGMLPHNTLGRAQLSKLKIYNGSEHPHTAQNPQPVSL